MDNSESTETAAIADSPSPWNVKQAILIGGILYILNIAFVFLYFIRVIPPLPFPWSSSFESLELLAILHAIAFLLVAIPILRSWRSGLGLDEWLTGIEWNPGKSFAPAALAGAVFAVLWTAFTRKFYVVVHFQERVPLGVGLFVIASVLLQPIIEEMYFRGMLFLALRKELGEITAIILVTVAFTLIHGKSAAFLVPAAILLGVVRMKTRSVASCFAFHAAYNLAIGMYRMMVP
jgi:membrane protease YdiL (CAAX protease family)